MENLQFVDALCVRLQKEVGMFMRGAHAYFKSSAFTGDRDRLMPEARVEYVKHHMRFESRMLAIIVWLSVRRDSVEEGMLYAREYIEEKRDALQFSTQCRDTPETLPQQFADFVRRSHSLQNRVIQLDDAIGEDWQKK